MVLTVQHQAAIKSLAGADVFNRVGVPGVQPQATFQHGGIAPSISEQPNEPIVINLFARVDAEGIAIEGMSGRNGEQVVINHIENARLRRGIRF
ncbi:MAG: hypothetical protein ACREA2_02610 [Blastocatellia bacterium]